ncbi:2Fe-2S iron-sulfur cluster-binding protein [Falsigemmobacter intermedius]|uniref:2Fe-2S iron-sulfur cluster-binding protein n=1 Tax=Falsigemmobacter intermedius TaxID=1553448 RepID=UPI003F04D510
MNVTFRWPDGRSETHSAAPGQSLMEVAVAANIDAIVAQCGGSCSCATCHCYIDTGPEAAKLPGSDMEDMLLDGVMAERRANSRLSCQLRLEAAHDGLVVELPECQ